MKPEPGKLYKFSDYYLDEIKLQYEKPILLSGPAETRSGLEWTECNEHDCFIFIGEVELHWSMYSTESAACYSKLLSNGKIYYTYMADFESTTPLFVEVPVET